MPKTSVNLIVVKGKESPVVKKLKVIFPILSFIFLVVFGCIFLVTFFYIQANSREFNLTQKEIERYEKQIMDKKTTEGIYTFTLSKLQVIDQLELASKNFSPAVDSIIHLDSSGITITSLTVEKSGELSMSIIASSSASMDMFVDNLVSKPEFSDVIAQGIIREKKGNYIVNISMKASKDLLE